MAFEKCVATKSAFGITLRPGVMHTHGTRCAQYPPRCARIPQASAVQMWNRAKSVRMCCECARRVAASHHGFQTRKTFRPAATRDGIPGRLRSAVPVISNDATPAPRRRKKTYDRETAELPHLHALRSPAEICAEPRVSTQTTDRIRGWLRARRAAAIHLLWRQVRAQLPARDYQAHGRTESRAG